MQVETKNLTLKSILITVAILAIIVYAIYWYGKKAATIPVPDKLPNSGNGIPLGWSPRPIVNKLHDVLGSMFTLANTKEVVLIELYNLQSDDMFVAASNDFNKLYKQASGQSLRQWIDNEYNTVLPFLGGVKDKLLARFDALKLS